MKFLIQILLLALYLTESHLIEDKQLWERLAGLGDDCCFSLLL